MLSKGDIVTAVLPGNYGKPRPAVIVQADPYAETHASLTVCPFTTHLTGLRFFRIAVAPDQNNGLAQPSEVMVDKIGSIGRDRIGNRIGRLSPTDKRAIDEALYRWLGLDDLGN
ncbi:MAG TPA: type II toxin-antitoxin system PemK/MazF family toxin [Opitutaceae bacterium]|nr:type II toxin-antitoxin system PemK/MazF family toxin [Opitutaceae bacterium]